MFDTLEEKKFLLKELVKRDFTAKYKDSILGVVWSFLNPLLVMLVFTAVFSVLFARTIENYPVYLLAGRIVFDFFSNGTKGAMTSIKNNSGILKKVYIPKYMFSISKITYEFVNFLITILILFGVMLATGAEFHITTLFVVVPAVFLVCMVIGVGLILSVCNTYFTDIGYLYNVFILLVMYASALFYPIEIVPSAIQRIFTLNPVYCAISCFRECIVYGVLPDLSTLLYLATFSVSSLFIGILVYNIYEKGLALKL